MIRHALIATAALALAATGTHGAKVKHVVQFKATDPVVLSPDKSYLLFRTNQFGKTRPEAIFVRDLTPDEVEAYKAAEAKAETKRQARALADLNASRQQRGLKPLAALPPQPADKKAPPPMLPVLKDGVPNVIRVAAKKALVKGTADNTYLMQVPAGTYLIAGQSFAGMIGGTCMCMGSVRFEAKPGQVTDLGQIVMAPESEDNDLPEFKGLAMDPKIKVTPWDMAIRPAVASQPHPSQLAAATIVPARYVPAGKFPNFFGMLVNRMPATAGVLAYDGDKAVPPTR